VTGERGIGKTALVRRFLRGASDFTVLHAACDRSELHHAYGVMRQLADRLPDGEALLGDLMADATSRSEFLGRLVRSVPEPGPVAMVIDDLQWADTQSLVCLRSFMLDPELAGHLLFICTSRTLLSSISAPQAQEAAGHQVCDALTSLMPLRLGRLAEQDIIAWALEAAAAPLAPLVAQQVYDRAQGHPGHTRCLLAELPGKVLADDQARAVPPTVLSSVQAHLTLFPPASRRLAQALAVLGEDQPLALVAETATVREAQQALEPLLTEDLVSATHDARGTTIRFCRLLEQDAVYALVAPAQRRALHQAAGERTSGEESLRHRTAAAASGGQHHQLVTALDHAAATAAEQGRLEQAVSYRLWAAQLSTTPATDSTRVLAAASELCFLGQRQRVQSMQPAIAASPPGAERSLALGQTERVCSVAAAHLFEGLRDARNRRTQAQLNTALAAIRLEQGQDGQACDLAEQALNTADLPPHLAALARHHLIMGILDHRGPKAALTRLTEIAPPERAANPRAVSQSRMTRGMVKAAAGHLQDAAQEITAGLGPWPHGRRYDLIALAASPVLAHSYFLTGAWQEADQTAQQAVAVATACTALEALPACHTAAAYVSAGRGAWQQAAGHVQGARQAAESRESPQGKAFVAIAMAVVATARADHTGVLACLQPLAEATVSAGGAYHLWWRPLLVESLIATGHCQEAGRSLREMQELSPALGDDDPLVGWLSGAIAIKSGKLQRGRDFYERALARSGPGRAGLCAARLEQACAEACHAMGDTMQAAMLADLALQHYEALGATPYAERCRAGFALHGLGTGLHREDLAVLTERERSVARLVARGLSNSEIAATLQISVKTVESHLSSIYGKLLITSRRELRQLLDTADSTVLPSG
jgi:DNA-binding CsgD family transcriptional regulator/tetratricopeptide (TPR) repeat protein